MLKNAIWLFTIAFLILVIFLPSFTKMQELKQKNLDYQAQIVQLKSNYAQLQIEKSRLESDPVYLEKVAREKMGLVKEGEMIYRMVPQNAEK